MSSLRAQFRPAGDTCGLADCPPAGRPGAARLVRAEAGMRLLKRAVVLAAILVVGGLAAGCGQSGGGAIKSAVASHSASARPPASSNATTAPAVPTQTTARTQTTAPTQTAVPTQTAAPGLPTPSRAGPPTPVTAAPPAPPASAPSPVTSATTTPVAGTGPTSPVVWLWVALGALVFIGLIAWIAHASSRRRAASAGWQSQVIDAYAKGAALQDAMSTAEAPGALHGADAGARWADIQRRADDLNQALYAMREAAPDEQARATVVDVLTSLQAVRSAMDAERVPGGAGGAQAEVVRNRLLAFEMSLRALRAPGNRPS